MTQEQADYLHALVKLHSQYKYKLPIRWLACMGCQRYVWANPDRYKAGPELLLSIWAEKYGWIVGAFTNDARIRYVYDPTYTNWFAVWITRRPNCPSTTTDARTIPAMVEWRENKALKSDLLRAQNETLKPAVIVEQSLSDFLTILADVT